ALLPLSDLHRTSDTSALRGFVNHCTNPPRSLPLVLVVEVTVPLCPRCKIKSLASFVVRGHHGLPTEARQRHLLAALFGEREVGSKVAGVGGHAGYFSSLDSRRSFITRPPV